MTFLAFFNIVFRFGPSCKPCQCSLHGTCLDGLNGNGKCFCDEGYIGDDCSVVSLFLNNKILSKIKTKLEFLYFKIIH